MHKHATMNRCFRLVWSAARGAMVAVAETSRGRGKTSGSGAAVLATTALGLSMALSSGQALAQTPAANALPTGAQVVSGSATLQQTGAQLTVQQASDRLITNWQTFNIGSAATVRFNQPGAGSVALNRVLSNDPSAIYGTLQSNGQVFLVNPSGVLFGASARVDVGGLVASSLQLGDADFLAGRYRFAGPGTSGAVGNAGRISAASGGYLAFIAPRVSNSGSLSAPQGTVALGAGEQASLDFAGDKLLRFTVDQGTLAALVDNKGLIQASGGSVVLSARAADAVTRAVVNQGGVVDASSLVARGGRIVLEGDAITLGSGSRTEAKGATGGGTVLVGGDWQGSGDMRQARAVTMSADASIDASATRNGDGGKIVLWSDVKDATMSTNAAGQLQARGGAEGGNGGQVETSGHAIETDGIRVDAGAPKGNGGLWLIDPADSVITQAVANGYQTTLNTGTSVLNDVTGTINWNSGVTLNKTAGGTATLTLRTGNASGVSDINLDNATIGSTAGALNLVLWTRFNTTGQGAAISLIGSSLNTNGGHFWAGGGDLTSWNGLAVGNDRAATFAGDKAGITMRNSSITTGAGDIFMAGSSFYTGGTANGVRNYGLLIDSGSNINTTSGNITLQGQLKGKYVNGAGISIGSPPSAPLAGNVAISTGSGAISITGAGEDQAGSGNGFRLGLVLTSIAPGAQTSIRSASGDITLNGVGAFGAGGDFTNDTAGLLLYSVSTTGQVQVVSSSGAITLSGQSSQQSSQFETAIRFATTDTANSIRIGSDGSTPYSGNILIEGDSLLQRTQQGGSGSISVQTTGGLTIAPSSASFVALRAGGASTLTFDDDWNFGTTLGSFTLGKATNTAGLTLSNPLSVAGAISLYGGDIALQSTLTSSAGPVGIYGGAVNMQQNLSAAGAITLKATTTDVVLDGAITNSATSATALTIEAGRHIRLGTNASIASTTAAMTTQLWADTNADADGIIYLTSSGITTHGGGLTFGRDGQFANIGGTSVRVGGDVFFNGSGAQAILTGGGQFDLYGESILANTAGLTISTSGGNVNFHGVLNSGNSYTFVDKTGTAGSGSWTQARTEARNGTSGGSGVGDSYLVTVTSRLENSLAGIAAGYRGAWIGAYRSAPASSYSWTWADGPEAGQPFLLQGGSGGGTAVQNRYNNFGSGEPNGALSGGSESVGQFFGTAGQWNDLAPSTTYQATQATQYSVLGFVRETNLANSPLTINAGGGAVTIDGAVGGSKPLAALTVHSSGTTVNGSALITSGAQSYSGSLSAVSTSDLTVGATTLTTAGSQAAVSLQAAGNVVLKAGLALTTNNGDLTLWSNSGNAGNGSIQLGDNNTLNTANGAANQSSGGGRITLSGGLDTSTGFAASTSGDGITLGTSASNTATLQSGGGDILLRGKSTATSGTYYGVDIYGGFQINAGQGAIAMRGESAASYGIEVGRLGGSASTLVSAKSTGNAIDIAGITTKASAHGLVFDFTTLKDVLATGGGNIALTGSAVTPGFYGVWLQGTRVLASSGNIAVDGGTRGITVRDSSVLGSLARHASVPNATGSVTLTGDVLTFNASGTSSLKTTGALTLQPFGTSFASAFDWDGSLSGGNFTGSGSLAGLTLNQLGSLGGLTVGKAGNTADITLSGATSIAGPMAFYGGNIALNANLTTTGSDAGVLLKASSGIVQAASTAVQTNGGDITFWSNSAADTSNTTGVGGIYLQDNATLDSRRNADRTASQISGATLGGAITLGGGNAGTTTTAKGTLVPTGYALNVSAAQAGLILGTNTQSGHAAANKLYSGGGNITLKGRSTQASGSLTIGITGYEGLTIDAGATGDISMTGAAENPTTSVISAGIDLQGWRVGTTAASNALIRSGDGNITITGTTTSTSASSVGNSLTARALAPLTIEATGSGAVTIIGQGGPNSSIRLNTVNILAASGAITLSGNSSGSILLQQAGGGASTIGKKAGSDVTASSSNLVLTSDAIILATGLTFDTTGTLVVQPYSTSFSSALTWPLANLTLGSGLSGLTLGKAGNTAAITIAGAQTVAGPINVFGGAINVNENLVANTGDVLLRGSGTTTIAAGKSVSTGNGDITITTPRFVNNGGASALVAGGTGKAWRVWSSNANPFGVATPDVNGGLVFDFKQYSATYGTSSVLGTGNGLFCNLAPTLTATLGGTATSKAYDGTLTAALTAANYSSSGAVNGDLGVVLSNPTSGSYATKNVGSGIAVTATGVTVLSATSSAATGAKPVYGYTVVGGSATGNIGTITPKALTATATAPDKVYDGTTTAAPTLALAGLVGSETIGVSATGSFNSKDVSTANTVTVNSTVLANGANGGLASNYSLASGQAAAAAITAKALTATVTAPDKVYDGTTAAAPTLAISAGLVGTETVGASGTASFDSKDVLTATTVTVNSTTLADGSNGGLASNYSLASGQTTAAAITTKALTATAIAADKVYDGSTSATAALSINAGLVGSEMLGATGTGTFNSKDVLTATTVTVNSTALADGSNGGLASNYRLAAGQTATAAITTKALTATATAPDKVYDGSTAATAALAISAGLVGTETLGATGTASFNSKDVLTADTVTVNSTSLANGSNGGLASNYSLASGQTAAAAITTKALTATATAADKVYDGGTAATAALAIGAGLVGTETLGVTGTGSFNSKDVLAATTVTVNATTLADGSNGGLASNYSLGAGQTAAAAVTAKALVATAIAADKVYDGSTAATAALSISAGLVGSETLGVTGTGSFNSKDVLTATTVTLNSTSLADGSNGGLASNYRLASGQTAAAAITTKALTATATAADKVYDGSTAAAPTLAISAGLIGSETLGVTGTGSFNTRDVLTATTVTVNSTTVADGSNGGLASNYSLAAGQTAAAAITPKAVTLAGNAGEIKTYDGQSTLAPGSVGHGSVAGLVVGDSVGVTGAPVFDSANAGARSVLQGTVALAGGDSANYSLGWTNGSGNIDRAALTVRAIDDARFVTQADAAGFNGASFSGLVHGETSAALGGTLSIARSNAGTNGAGTYAGVLVPGGLSAANYNLTYADGDYTIVPAGQLLVRTANTSMVYGSAPAYSVLSAQYLDGDNLIHTLAAPGVMGNSYTYDDGAGGVATFTLAPRNAVRSGAGALAVGNYGTAAGSISGNSANFSDNLVVVGSLAVTPMSVSAAAGGVSKVYDGNTATTGLTLNLTGLLAGDTVSASGNGQFESRNVGTGIGYAVNGLALRGADAGNYLLGAGTMLAGTDGSITPKGLMVSGITAADKVYDGSTVASVNSSNAMLAGLVAGDVLNVSANGQFEDKNAAGGKVVTLTSSYSGADAGNYRIASQGSTTASITRLAQVSWTGGATGNWFDPANWAGGAVPDLANVSQVVIPAGVTVTFGDTLVAPAARGPVQIDRLGTSGSLAMTAGTLNVGTGGVELARLVQSGGALSSVGDMRLGSLAQSGGSTTVQGVLSVTEDFEQGRNGSVAVRGGVDITDTRGGVVLGNLNSGGPLVVRSQDGDVRQAPDTTLVAQDRASFTARTANGQAADVVLAEATNDFRGRVDLDARNAQLVDRDGLALGMLALTGDLNVSSTGNLELGQGTVGGRLIGVSHGGDVTQTGALTVNGGTDIAAGAGHISLADPGNRLGGQVQLVADGGVTVVGANSAGVTAATNAATQALTLAAASRDGAMGAIGASGVAAGLIADAGKSRPVSVSIGGVPETGERLGRVHFVLHAAERNVDYEAELVGTTLRISALSANAASSVARDQVIEAALQALESQLALPRSRVAVVYVAM